MAGPTTPSSGGVFISYRRQDTAPYARLLREELSRRLGAQQVFMDVDSIEVGVDFAEAIQRAVGACEVLLALVGPQWLTVTDADGQRRLDDPDDIVRVEIEAALAREVRVIPVLVDDTRMPRRQELPDSLAPLARRNALELTYNRYAYDLERLLEAVEKLVSRTATPIPPPAASTSPSSSVRGTRATDTEALAVSPSPAGGADLQSVAHLLQEADASIKGRNYDEALRDLNRALELDPSNARALGARGNIYQQTGHYDKALRDLNRALELHPSNAFNLGFRGNIYQQTGHYDEALRDLNRALELNPRYSYALVVRGTTYRKMGRYKEASRDLNLALRLDSGNDFARKQRELLPRRFRLLS